MAEAKPFFVAHRGGIVPGIPENTLLAFREALRHGVDGIEVDLRGTADGEVVVLHDATVDRTTNGQGRVADLSFTALGALDAGAGERVPTLAEVLELVRPHDVTLLLDIKESPTLDKARVVDLVRASKAIDRVIVGCRSLDDLHAFQQLEPRLRTLGFLRRPEDVDDFARAGVDIVRFWPAWIRDEPQAVARVRALGLPLWTTAGTATLAEVQALVRSGADGVLSDYPMLQGALRP